MCMSMRKEMACRKHGPLWPAEEVFGSSPPSWGS